MLHCQGVCTYFNLSLLVSELHGLQRTVRIEEVSLKLIDHLLVHFSVLRLFIGHEPDPLETPICNLFLIFGLISLNYVLIDSIGVPHNVLPLNGQRRDDEVATFHLGNVDE